jgi:G:T-mismatch repair DNA endonuclease (very short patch repair protein)
MHRGARDLRGEVLQRKQRAILEKLCRRKRKHVREIPRWGYANTIVWEQMLRELEEVSKKRREAYKFLSTKRINLVIVV